MIKIKHPYQIWKQTSMGKNILCVMGLSWYNPSGVVEVTFNDYCGYMHSAAAKSEWEIAWKAPSTHQLPKLHFFRQECATSYWKGGSRNNSLTSVVCFTIHLFLRISHRHVINFSVPYRIFLMEKSSNLKNMSDRLSKSFSSTNQPHFTRMAFINCQKDGRSS